jgi:chromosome partitioning protein
MLTIAVLSQKGGSGKTTVATNLAAAALLEDEPTILIDLDRQQSAVDWSYARPLGSRLREIHVVDSSRPSVSVRKIRELSAGYGVAILDGPPRLGDMTRAAAMAADVVLVPLQPSQLDLWAYEETAKVLDEADRFRNELGREPAKRLLVLNRAVARSRMARSCAAALETYDVVGALHQRQAFPEATASGESVLTTDANSDAAFEVRRLWRAVRGQA